MKLKSRKKLKFKRTFLWWIVILGALGLLLFKGWRLRQGGLGTVPPPGINFDEHDYAWIGLSLIRNHVPTSWSIFSFYRQEPKGPCYHWKDGAIAVNEVKPTLSNFANFPKPITLVREIDYGLGLRQVLFVQPDLDHPPLAGLIVGSFIRLNGGDEEQLSPFLMRQASLFAGIITVFLIFILSWLTYGRKVALLAAAISATSPLFVISSRMALAENFLIPMMLLSLIFLSIFSRSKKLTYLIIAAFMSGMAVLFKVAGVSVIFAGFLYLIFSKATGRHLFIFGLISLLVAALYPLYGYIYDWPTFWAVITHQSKRTFLGPLFLLETILTPNVIRSFIDGWWIFGWMAVFLLLFRAKLKDHIALKSGFIGYLITFLVLVNYDPGSLGYWYRFPFLPFLAIASGVLIMETIKSGNLGYIILFLVGPLASGIQWAIHPVDWGSEIWLYRAGITILTGVLLATFLPKDRPRWRQFSFLILVLISLYLNIQGVYWLDSHWTELEQLTTTLR